MVNKDILEALELLTHKGFSNNKPKDFIVRQKEVLDTKKFTNKSILIIDSTGDIAFDVVRSKAKKIDCFLENIFAKYYIELKVCFVKKNDYQNFVKFFIMTEDNNNLFSYKLYYEISRYLTEKTRLFWDALYENTNYDGMKIRTSNLFEQKYHKPDSYIAEKDYYHIKDHFNCLEINYLDKLENNNYDYVIINKEFYDKYKSFLEKIPAKKIVQ